MRIFFSLLLSLSFVSSLFAVSYHPLSLCYEGGWEESCPSMECCIGISANDTEPYSFIPSPSCFEVSPLVIGFDLFSEEFVQNTSLPPHGVFLWLAQKTSLP